MAYSSTYELASSVKAGEVSELDEKEVIGRIYTVEQIRTIARHLGVDALSSVNSVTGVQGVQSCYDRAEKLVAACKTDRAKLGRAVLDAEHEQVFTLLSYFGVPKGLNADQYWAALSQRRKIKGQIDHFVKPFLKPGNLDPRLESAKRDGDRVTLVFAQLRVMRKSLARTNDVDNLFVARVPVLVSLLFDLGIIEISMPHFADPSMPYHTETFPQQFPGRAFRAIESCRAALKTEADLSSAIPRLPRDNLMIYLETDKGGEDLGWDVERLTGKRGKFNTTQRIKIPLKEILTEFTEELAAKCKSGNYVNPLEGSNLYEIFRTLKSESHTVSMEMGVALGKRAGRVALEAFYGNEGDAHNPLYWVQSKLSADAREELRIAVSDCASRKDLKDPYSITTKFKKKGP